MRWIRWVLGAGLVGLSAIQLVPYGRDHTNPPVVTEPPWDSQTTRDLAVGACFDCHSNETDWAWYTNVAPVSWMVQRDVDEGRRKLNFSEWPSGEDDDAAETVREETMPPAGYKLMHGSARLSGADAERLASGLEATLGEGDGDDSGRGGDGGDDPPGRGEEEDDD